VDVDLDSSGGDVKHGSDLSVCPVLPITQDDRVALAWRQFLKSPSRGVAFFSVQHRLFSRPNRFCRPVGVFFLASDDLSMANARTHDITHRHAQIANRVLRAPELIPTPVQSDERLCHHVFRVVVSPQILRKSAQSPIMDIEERLQHVFGRE
jgi:hypothetical protein